MFNVSISFTIQPLSDLIGVLSSLHTAEGEIAVEGLLDGVRGLSEEERKRLQEVGHCISEREFAVFILSVDGSPDAFVLRRWT